MYNNLANVLSISGSGNGDANGVNCVANNGSAYCLQNTTMGNSDTVQNSTIYDLAFAVATSGGKDATSPTTTTTTTKTTSPTTTNTTNT